MSSTKVARSGDWKSQKSQKNFSVESWSKSPTSFTFYPSSVNFSALSGQLSPTHSTLCPFPSITHPCPHFNCHPCTEALQMYLSCPSLPSEFQAHINKCLHQHTRYLKLYIQNILCGTNSLLPNRHPHLHHQVLGQKPAHL